MRYEIVAEVREDFPSLIDDLNYNDYVSKKSMMELCDTLKQLGYDCGFLGGTKKLFALYKSRHSIENTIFINYNYGLPALFKRAQSPILFELMKAKYSGANPIVSLLVNDKELTKKILRNINILSPRSILVFNTNITLDKIKKSALSLPLVVKPNCEGSSLGIYEESLCDSYEDTYKIASKLLADYSEVIIEEYIAGYECTVWMIGNSNNFRLVAPLLISEKGEYYFEHKIFTITSKANHTREYSLPETHLNLAQIEELKKLSINIFSELGLRDYARLDFRISKGGIYFIEANALPIFSMTSEIGSITKLYDIQYSEICKMVIETTTSRLMTKTY